MTGTWPLTPALSLALALALAGCAGAPPEQRALEATERNLARIRSGTLSMRLLATPAGGEEGAGVGFEVTGPFAVAEEEGRLPVADLTYTRVTGGQRRTTRFVSTGTEAFVELDGTVRPLAPEQVADLRARGDADDGTGGLEGLHLDDWMDHVVRRPGPPVEGVATESLSGPVDAVAALNDMLELAQRLGAGEGALRRLEGAGAERVRRTVRAGSAGVVTGRDDRLLRRLQLDIELGVEDQEAVRAALGDLAGVALRLELSVTGLNRPVRVAAPGGAGP